MEKMVEQLSGTAKDVFDGVDKIAETTEKKIEKTVAPMRKGVFKRFPTLFLLAGTFGVSATFYGIEQVIVTTPFLNGNPWISIIFGVGILTITGQLYKKLG